MWVDLHSDSTEAPFFGSGSFTMPLRQQAISESQDTDFCRVECLPSSKVYSDSRQSADWFKEIRLGIAAALERQSGGAALPISKRYMKR